SLYGTGVTVPDIDIGVPAENYTASWTDGTLVNQSNPANETGKITTVQVYSKANMTTVWVATFYRPDPSGFPNNLTTRDSEYISDLIVAGFHGYAVDLEVEAGDYIGIMFQNGDIEKKIGGEVGLWYINFFCIFILLRFSLAFNKLSL
ncbi:unnamed protein product, partial [marine sediment metagenome]